MNNNEINALIRKLAGQLQNLEPQLVIARGKEAWVMQENQDSEIVGEVSQEEFGKYLGIIKSAQKNAHLLFDIIPHILITTIRDNLFSLDQPLQTFCFIDKNTGHGTLHEGYIEDYINSNKDTLTTLRQLSQELSGISPALVVWQNIIREIESIASKSASYNYSNVEAPSEPYDKIREDISELLNTVKSAQKICIQISENATAALVKLHQRISGTEVLVNRKPCKGETPPHKLNSIQDDLSQAFKKIEMEYRDLLEDFVVEFEVGRIKQAGTGQEEQDRIAIDDKELTILAELAEGTDKTFSQVEIEAATNIKRGTLKDKLPRLESIGLVFRPLGERKGYQITDKGKEIAQRNQ